MKSPRKVFLVLATQTLIPSDLVGLVMPAKFLNIPIIFLKGDEDISKITDMIRPDILIFGKCLNSHVVNLAKKARKKNIITISSFNDWHFKPLNLKQEKQFYLNDKLLQNSDHIVVKSIDAGKVIRMNKKINFNVIHDCLRYPPLENIYEFKKDINLMWFGSSSNHDTLIKGLKEIEEYKIKRKIFVITNKIENIYRVITKNKFKYVSLEIITFTETNLIEAAKQSSIILMPLIEDHIRLVKSSNRIIDALNLGRFVVKSKTKFHDELDKYCFVGNMGDGINWFISNFEKAKNKIDLGKKFVQSNFSINEISKSWTNLLDNI